MFNKFFDMSMPFLNFIDIVEKMYMVRESDGVQTRIGAIDGPPCDRPIRPGTWVCSAPVPRGAWHMSPDRPLDSVVDESESEDVLYSCSGLREKR